MHKIQKKNIVRPIILIIVLIYVIILLNSIDIQRSYSTSYYPVAGTILNRYMDDSGRFHDHPPELNSKIKVSDFRLQNHIINSKTDLIRFSSLNQLTLSVPSITDIPVGNYPIAIAVNDKTNIVYVVNRNSGNISLIGGVDNRLLQSIPVNATDLDINSNTSKIYVANSFDDTIAVIDANTHRDIIKRIQVDNGPTSIAVNQKINKIYVANLENHTVSVIDGIKDEVVKTIQLGVHPYAMAINPNTNMIYVANIDDDTVSVIDGLKDEVVKNITIGESPSAIDANPKEFPIGESPSAIAVNPKTNMVYGVTGHANRIFVIDGNSNTFNRTFITGDISPSFYSAAIAVDPETNLLYMTNPGSNTVSKIDSSRGLISEFQVGKSPQALDINPTTNKIYVANSVSDTVSVVDGPVNGDKPIRPKPDIAGIKVGEKPLDISVNPTTNKIYVANSVSDTVSVVDGSNDTVIAHIPVGKTPSALAINQLLNRIYVANSGNDIISVIDGSVGKVNFTIPVEGLVRSIGAASKTSGVYVVTIDNITRIEGTTNKAAANITLDEVPQNLAPDIDSNQENIDRIYALGNQTLYIIDIKNKSLSIPDNIHEISLKGSPSAIAVNPNTNMVYVANRDSNTISVIDLYINKIVADIPVGKDPEGIAINPNTNMIYVANIDDDTVSVIDGLHNVVETNVNVGSSPSAIAVNPNTNMVYVANRDSNTISVIDGTKNEVIVGVAFGISPSNSGHIRCGDKEFATNQFHRIKSGTNCVPQANIGFQFSGWNENLGGNATATFSTTNTVYNNIPDIPIVIAIYTALDSFFRFFGYDKLTPDVGSFQVSEFGNFTANFKEVSPPIPQEYLIPLYGVVVSSIIGWSIPGIIRLIGSHRQKNEVRKYKKRIDGFKERIESTNNSSIANPSDRNILDKIKTDVSDAYAHGNINESQYKILQDQISELFQDSFLKRINAADKEPNQDDDAYLQTLDKIKTDVSDAYADGKISEVQYKILVRNISTRHQPIFSRMINSLDGDSNEFDKRLEKVNKSIINAYADGKMTESQYKVLKADVEKKEGQLTSNPQRTSKSKS